MLRIAFIGIPMFTLRLVVETVEVNDKRELPMDSYQDTDSNFCIQPNARLDQGEI